MTDRPHTTPATPTGTASALLRQRRSSSPSEPSEPSEPPGSPGSRGEDNPFAPPPEGRPDQPWRPRRRGGSGDGAGDDPDGGGDQPGTPPKWSSRQPGRQGGPGWLRPDGAGRGGPGGMRWDPSDPAQRRARYALLCGMWGFFFALFAFPWLATPLGALAVYWGVSTLRGEPEKEDAHGGRPGARAEDVAGTERSAPQDGPAPQAAGARPQATAAVSGLATGILALAIVAAQFSVQLAYRDYFACVEDALTNASRATCERHLPEQLRPFFEERR